ncbi:hypothetical protein GGD38_004296 [Chitinophagaceae bacterium OAS944]|nr:hypothetical protein [Chitinophagaceae bacterium OAS944]
MNLSPFYKIAITTQHIAPDNIIKIYKAVIPSSLRYIVKLGSYNLQLKDKKCCDCIRKILFVKFLICSLSAIVYIQSCGGVNMLFKKWPSFCY